MSIWLPIRGTIRAHEAAGRLVAVLPRSPHDPVIRQMFLVRELHQTLYGPHPDVRDEERYQSLQADLEVFVTGQLLTNSYLKSLRPPHKAVWEIRSKRPRPSVRVFGLFASRDVFIGTNYQVRNQLGGFDSIEWKAASRLARHEWCKLFATDPLVGELRAVVSGGVYD